MGGLFICRPYWGLIMFRPLFICRPYWGLIMFRLFICRPYWGLLLFRPYWGIIMFRPLFYSYVALLGAIIISPLLGANNVSPSIHMSPLLGAIIISALLGANNVSLLSELLIFRSIDIPLLSELFICRPYWGLFYIRIAFRFTKFYYSPGKLGLRLFRKAWVPSLKSSVPKAFPNASISIS